VGESTEKAQKLTETFAAYIDAQAAADRAFRDYQQMRCSEAQANAELGRAAAAQQAHLDAIKEA
jgi:hypothetical protein